MNPSEDVDAPDHARRLATMGSGLFASGFDLDEASVQACGRLAHALAESRPVGADEPAFALAAVARAVEEADCFEECRVRLASGARWGDVEPATLFAALVAIDAARVTLEPDVDGRMPEIAVLKAMLPAREVAPALGVGF